MDRRHSVHVMGPSNPFYFSERSASKDLSFDVADHKTVFSDGSQSSLSSCDFNELM